MKSIIEEASSISKAIEKGWQRAGKPRSFNIKIYEEPEKNFFGLTTKSAKIAILFEEKQADQLSQPKGTPYQRPSRSSHSQEPFERSRKTPKPTASEHLQDGINKPTASPWNEQMVDIVKLWLRETLDLMGLKGATFSAMVSKKQLLFTFERPVFSNEADEKALFRSLSHLALTTLRNKLKQNVHALKIVLTSEQK